MKELKLKLSAGYPTVALLTHEEARAEASIARDCEELERDVYVWTLTEGLRGADTYIEEDSKNPPQVLAKIEEKIGEIDEDDEGIVFVLKDFHHYVDNNQICRMIRDLIPMLKKTGSCIIFLGPNFEPAVDLQREVVKLPFKLPDRVELEQNLMGICEQNGVEIGENGEKDQLLEAGLGLTTIEYENALAESIVESKGNLDPTVVSRVKCEIVAAGGLLELAKTDELPDVGGNKNLIEWLEQRRGTFGKKAREYGLRAPKGVLLVGRPGCGKSLVGKLAAKYLGVPYVWGLDMGKLKNKFVGETERQTREVFDAAEASAPNAILIDEIDKVGPKDASQGDSHEVSQSTLGTMLARMQDRPKDKMVFYIFTANSISGIPPALLRRGRIDEIFLVDLPDAFERREIIEVHLKLRKRDPKSFNVAAVAEACADFTGAEIEAAIEEAMVKAFQDNREFEDKDIIDAMKEMSPQARLQPEVAREFEDWLKAGKARPASRREGKDQVYKIGARKIKKN